MTLHIAQDPEADRVLAELPFALLMGMMLDQQFPMERAFAGPPKVLDRFGTLDPSAIAVADPEEFAALCAVPPAVHRFPGSMAARIQQLARIVTDEYDGQADRLWTEAGSGDTHAAAAGPSPVSAGRRRRSSPRCSASSWGCGPTAGRRAAGDYAEAGAHRSVADLVDAASLEKVRAFKKEKKRAAASS